MWLLDAFVSHGVGNGPKHLTKVAWTEFAVDSGVDQPHMIANSGNLLIQPLLLFLPHCPRKHPLSISASVGGSGKAFDTLGLLQRHSTLKRRYDTTIAQGRANGNVDDIDSCQHRPSRSGGNTSRHGMCNCVRDRGNRSDESCPSKQRESHQVRTRNASGSSLAAVDDSGCAGQNERSAEYALLCLRPSRHFASNRAGQPVGQRGRNRPMHEGSSRNFCRGGGTQGRPALV
jgi:hypothetical protein